MDENALNRPAIALLETTDEGEQPAQNLTGPKHVSGGRNNPSLEILRGLCRSKVSSHPQDFVTTESYKNRQPFT